MMNLAAVIPAAGLSSRMDGFTPLLPLGEHSLLSRCVELLWGNDVRQIIVVTKKNDYKLEEAAQEVGAEVVHNTGDEQDMFSSVVAGVRAFHKEVSGFFLLPAAIPLVRTKTVTRLIQAFEKKQSTVLHPRFQGKRGHPPLIHGRLAPMVAEQAGRGGLDALLDGVASEASCLDVADYGVLHVVDAPEDYAFAQQRAGTTFPFPEECEQLWDLYATSPETRAHCRAVSRVAVLLCDKLNALRSEDTLLDRRLVEGAALTHDVGKGMKRHDAVGGEWLAIHGFDDAAEIVRQHSDLALLSGDPITEKEIVFLADKLVRGTIPVSLDDRYGEKLALYGHVADARTSILGRRKRGRAVLRRFQEELGLDPEALARDVLA